MHKSAFLWVLVASVSLFLAAPAARADSVLVGAPTPLDAINPFLYPEPNTAVQFSLSGAEFVTTINFNFVGSAQPGIPVTLSLVNALTGPATTFGTFNFLTTSAGTDTFTAALAQNLAAGTYYLIVASNVPAGDTIAGWEDSNGTLIQTAGTVANGQWSSPDGTTWGFFDNTVSACIAAGSNCFPGVFNVNGSPATTAPEPSSLLLLGSGLLGLMGMGWRRKGRLA